MSRRFDVAELLRVAVQDERSGRKLYLALADNVDGQDLAETFSRLAEQEAGHARRFQQMLDDLDEPDDSFQYPDEYVDYLEVLVDQAGHEHPEQQAANCETDLDAVELALRFEREQLALQQDIADALGDADSDAINAVVREERAHLVQLTSMRKKVAT
jgi:rubrerythrin